MLWKKSTGNFLSKCVHIWTFMIILLAISGKIEMANVQIPPSDPRIHYEGRWIINGTTTHGDAARADWPCSGIHFIVEVQCESKGPIIFFFDGRSPFRHKQSFFNYQVP